jgi:hypothetical protein
MIRSKHRMLWSDQPNYMLWSKHKYHIDTFNKSSYIAPNVFFIASTINITHPDMILKRKYIVLALIALFILVTVCGVRKNVRNSSIWARVVAKTAATRFYEKNVIKHGANLLANSVAFYMRFLDGPIRSRNQTQSPTKRLRLWRQEESSNRLLLPVSFHRNYFLQLCVFWMLSFFKKLVIWLTYLPW